MRVVKGPLTVRQVPPPPFTTNSRRPTGVLGKGILYEDSFAKYATAARLGTVAQGLWFHYIDSRKSAYCQVDVVLAVPGKLVLFECKLTQCEDGDTQLRRYRPIVEKWCGHRVVLVQVYKNATYYPEGQLLTHLQDALFLKPGAVAHGFQWRPE